MGLYNEKKKTVEINLNNSFYMDAFGVIHPSHFIKIEYDNDEKK